MTKGKTMSGFRFQFDEKKLKDMRVIELLASVDSNPLHFPALVRAILGDEQKEALYNHVEKDGIVSAEDISKELEDIFNVAKEQSEAVKNS